MAFEETSGGLGGLGGFMSGLGDKLGSNDMLTALALMDAGRARVNPPPLAQTLGPIMQMQAKKQDQERERTALTAALMQLGLPADQAHLMAASDSAAKIALQVNQLKQQRGAYDNLLGTIGKTAPGWGGDTSATQKRSDATDLPDAATPFHNLVANAEGTAQGRGYDETLGYGKFTGGPVNLTGMKVADVLGLQQQMLQHPENNFNSSAAGAYQVVGKTLRGLVDQGVVSPDDPYDAATQNKIASFLAQQRGPNPAALRAEWAGLKNVPDAQIVQAWNASFGGQPGHLTEPPPMNLGGADTPTQVASADPNFVPIPPVRPTFTGAAPEGYDWKTATEGETNAPGAVWKSPTTGATYRNDTKGLPTMVDPGDRARGAPVAQGSSAATDAPQPGVPAGMPAGKPPLSPDAVTGERTQKALALKNFDYWTKAMLAASNPALGDAGKGVMEMAKANIAIASKYLEPTEIQRNLDALTNATPAEKQEILRNAIPDHTPSIVREARTALAEPKVGEEMIRQRRAGSAQPDDVETQERVKGLSKGLTETANDYGEAKKDLAIVQRLNTLLNQAGNGVGTAAAEEIRRRTGIALDPNADKVQAASALLEYLVPRQRVSGSGTSSDRDMAAFRAALPSLKGTPEGNRIAIETLGGIAQLRLEQAKIATDWQTGDITAKDAVKQMRDMPDPFETFRGWQASNGGAKAPAEAPAADRSEAPRPNRVVPSFADIPEGATYRAPESGRVYKKVNGKAVPVKE